MSWPFSLYMLDPPSLRLCLDVEKFSSERLKPLMGKRLLLALSGGADSTAMACIFALIAARSKLFLQAMHINHKIRPEAAKEAEFAARLCESLSIPFFYAEFDAVEMAREYGIGLEEAGRKGRYALLEEGRKKTVSDNVLVAHHSGDLCEDILMRIIRGTGWPALGGMRSINGSVFRPLLHIERQRLLRLLRFLGQDWCEDPSNFNLSFRRNRIRANFLPLLKAENPSIERSFNNLHMLSLADDEFWQDYLEGILKEHPATKIIDDFGMGLELGTSALLGQPLAVRLRLYYYIIRKLCALFPDMRTRPQMQFEKLVALDKAFLAKRSGKIFQFQGGLTARLYKSRIIFLIQGTF